ncbi:GNAT family N-acetyltransferase [Sporosarcina sp. USHLN248]|uniref:GNAT family N-acetyltransferase n=1 Tax=Sporosarcina sp. USHLN248 TaxID=3081300 RepID=UPI0030192A4D
MFIRKADLRDADGIAKVHVDSWRTTYEGIVAASYLEGLSYEQRTANWKRGIGVNPLYVAERKDGKIIGFATGGRERTGKYDKYKGELYAIYLLKEAQEQGIGTALIRAVATELQTTGFTSMLIWVLEQNRSKLFYERLGGKVIDQTTITIGGEKFIEVAYGWEDIDVLFNKA